MYIIGLVLRGVVATAFQKVYISEEEVVYAGNVTAGLHQLFFTFCACKGTTQFQGYPLLVFTGEYLLLTRYGTSPQYYNLAGIGPFTLEKDMTLKKNTNSLNTKYHLLFIDPPNIGNSISTASVKTQLQQSSITALGIQQFFKQDIFSSIKAYYLVVHGANIRNIQGYQNASSLLKGVFAISPWPQFYAMGKYYGIAGLEMKLFGNSQKLIVEATFETCYFMFQQGKFKQAHRCYESTLSYVQSKTQNRNLYFTSVGSQVIKFPSMVEYYFSKYSVAKLYYSQSQNNFNSKNQEYLSNTYQQLFKNYSNNVTYWLKDNPQVFLVFVGSDTNFIEYFQAVQNWIQNDIDFLNKSTFVNDTFKDITLKGDKIGRFKGNEQVSLVQVFKAGHYIFHQAKDRFIQVIDMFINSTVIRED